MKTSAYRTEHQRRTEARARLSRQSDAARLDAMKRYRFTRNAESERRLTIAAVVSWTLVLAFSAYAAYLYVAL